MLKGRPRKLDASRKPAGRLREVPRNAAVTAEQQKRITYLTGNSRRGDAESPMGVLVAHGIVDQDVREKITTPYMLAKKTCFGTYGPACPGDGSERGHQTSNDGAERNARKHIARCDRVLKRLKFDSSRELFDTFVVRETFPFWMTYKPGSPPLVLDMEYNFELMVLVEILKRLAKEFGIRKPVRTEMVVTRNFQQAEPV